MSQNHSDDEENQTKLYNITHWNIDSGTIRKTLQNKQHIITICYTIKYKTINTLSQSVIWFSTKQATQLHNMLYDLVQNNQHSYTICYMI